MASGEGALARPGQAPERRVVVKPREAVEWALYYPPLVDPRPESYPPALRATLSAYRANDLPAAFAALERVPAADRDGRYLLLRAGLLLSVGRVAKAEADLAEAERADPKSGGASALRSVIALVRDQKDEALRLAESGAGLDPNSPLPQAALSYAHQGRFEIEKALEHAKRAVELAPEDPLLWARVSELELSRGDLDAALEAAQKAETLSPALARTQTVLGFAYLTRIEVDKAKSAFERAIQGDPADPLPRLGMGLAKIRDGRLDEGTREIETAASLDPNNSLVRSYLGKAYYEQKRDGLASSEYEHAKLLDPKDPTPWFYDAIHKQSTNRPVEALQDITKAIELNENRAVYRSKLLLDQDLAARSAALGRIYSDLGFEQLALVQGWKSVNTDPRDYSGHRLLADSYASLPRHEVARVSELLQTQLLQPINITPVQPSLTESDLLILEGSGPSTSAFNEFNPLFARNRLALQTSAFLGSHDTVADEITQSGLWQQFSYSLGQFHFETDGFRENSDLAQDLYQGFFQASLSPSLSVLAELTHRESQQGNISLEFFPRPRLDNRFGPCRSDAVCRREENEDSYRIGLRTALAPHSDIIATVSYLDAEDFRFDASRDSPRIDQREGYSAEAQYLFSAPRLRAIAGAGYYSLDVASRDATTHGNGYLYTYLAYPASVVWTLGLSYDELRETDLSDIDELNPKFGMLWSISPRTSFRLAAFKVLKRSLLTDQTIEPTQVAGFNQLFDDFPGTRSTRYGIGLDHSFSAVLYGGLEASRRELRMLTILDAEDEDPDLPAIADQDWNEETYRAYIGWAPTANLSLGLEYQYERFDRDSLIDSPTREVFFDDGLPPRTTTHTVPLSLTFHHFSGLTASLVTTIVKQGVERITSAPFDSNVEEGLEDNDEFALVDVAVGYRLPKRYGTLAFGVTNVLDTEFNFEGFDLRNADKNAPAPFVPERMVSFQAILAF
ncbi:MAG: TonB-dependent receptor [Gammaproteobacteria bacterium]